MRDDDVNVNVIVDRKKRNDGFVMPNAAEEQKRMNYERNGKNYAVRERKLNAKRQKSSGLNVIGNVKSVTVYNVRKKSLTDFVGSNQIGWTMFTGQGRDRVWMIIEQEIPIMMIERDPTQFHPRLQVEAEVMIGEVTRIGAATTLHHHRRRLEIPEITGVEEVGLQTTVTVLDPHRVPATILGLLAMARAREAAQNRHILL